MEYVIPQSYPAAIGSSPDEVIDVWLGFSKEIIGAIMSRSWRRFELSKIVVAYVCFYESVGSLCFSLSVCVSTESSVERDPHGNVQVARIETEKMLIEMVETELQSRRKHGLYNMKFGGQSHFFGYEGRCGLPSNFDSNYCYALGYAAGALIHSEKTGLIASVGNLGAPVEKWTVGGTALTSLMDVERRHGCRHSFAGCASDGDGFAGLVFVRALSSVLFFIRISSSLLCKNIIVNFFLFAFLGLFCCVNWKL